jgi:hypothetical protein
LRTLHHAAGPDAEVVFKNTIAAGRGLGLPCQAVPSRARFAGGNAYSPSSIGIGADPGHHPHRKPSTIVPTEAIGYRSTVRRSIARLYELVAQLRRATKGEDYRHNAAELMRLAEHAQSPMDKTHLVTLAEGGSNWLRRRTRTVDLASRPSCTLSSRRRWASSRTDCNPGTTEVVYQARIPGAQAVGHFHQKALHRDFLRPSGRPPPL